MDVVLFPALIVVVESTNVSIPMFSAIEPLIMFPVLEFNVMKLPSIAPAILYFASSPNKSSMVESLSKVVITSIVL